MELEIRPLANDSEADLCAIMMANSEPWITLLRDYTSSLSLVANPLRETHVALIDQEIAGFVVFTTQSVFGGYIQSVCVAPEFRGKGIGSQLIAFAEKDIFAASPNAFICASSFNPDARRLYERLGYVLVGELTDFNIPGHSELLMRKTTGPRSEFVKS